MLWLPSHHPSGCCILVVVEERLGCNLQPGKLRDTHSHNCYVILIVHPKTFFFIIYKVVPNLNNFFLLLNIKDDTLKNVLPYRDNLIGQLLWEEPKISWIKQTPSSVPSLLACLRGLLTQTSTVRAAKRSPPLPPGRPSKELLIVHPDFLCRPKRLQLGQSIISAAIKAIYSRDNIY